LSCALDVKNELYEQQKRVQEPYLNSDELKLVNFDKQDMQDMADLQKKQTHAF